MTLTYSESHELIDTCWNVNCAFDIETTSFYAGINRYMLECKYCYGCIYNNLCCELIDTCWNVNIKFNKSDIVFTYELIDTCWNVN